MKSFKSFTLAVFLVISAGHAALSQGCNLSSEEFMRSAPPETIIDCVAALQEPPPVPVVKNLVRFGDWFSVDTVLASLSDNTMNALLSASENHVPTLMHMAVNNPDPAVLAVLADWGFDPNAMTEFDGGGWLGLGSSRGTTPLHLAAKGGKADHVAMLLAIGADPTNDDKKGRTPDSLAEGRYATMYVFKSNEAPGGEETVKSIIYDMPFDFRARKSPVSCDRFLTKLFFQNATGSDIRSCYKQGASSFGTNKKGDTALHLASAWGSPQTILSVVRAAPRDQLKSLLALKNLDGNTPLHYAARYSNDPDNVSLLIALGASPTAKDRKGRVPLHLAAKRGDEIADAIVVRLLAGSPVDTSLLGHVKEPKDNQGNTPLHMAASWDHIGLSTLFLLDHRYNPDTPNNKGITPLMYAATAKTTDQKFTSKRERYIFETLLRFSKHPCKTIDQKYGKRAGTGVFDFAKSNPALTESDTSGKSTSAVSDLLQKCSQ